MSNGSYTLTCSECGKAFIYTGFLLSDEAYKCRECLVEYFHEGIAELQSTITAQEDIIKQLKEDAERLFIANNMYGKAKKYYVDNKKLIEKCELCGTKRDVTEEGEYEPMLHADDCPITSHTQLMNELGEK